jgi:hypothetical protein
VKCEKDNETMTEEIRDAYRHTIQSTIGEEIRTLKDIESLLSIAYSAVDRSPAVVKERLERSLDIISAKVNVLREKQYK